LRLPAGNIDVARPLSEIGMDSLMAVELRLALEARLLIDPQRIDQPLWSLCASVTSIATRLASALASTIEPGQAVEGNVRAVMFGGGFKVT
jgi:phthiocerol/phenolphthiocerol synthesis type-I polyketide synthase C